MCARKPPQATDALTFLGKSDAVLAELIAKHGPPPQFSRPARFETLVQIILEQQVSLKSAAAMHSRLKSLLGPVSAETVLSKSAQQLRDIGITRQKTRYLHSLAEHVQSGQLRLSEFPALPDDEIRTQLTAVTGIGDWTANVYLLMALQRPDIWLPHDRALVVAVSELYGISDQTSASQISQFANRWQPQRSMAVRLLWQYYLTR